MPKFGTRSKKNLSEAHPDLQRLFNEVIRHYDCSVIEGARGKEEQNRLYSQGKSQLKYPNSKHNIKPGQKYSMAVDVVPYHSDRIPHIDWNDVGGFKEFCWFVKGVAAGIGVEIVSGGLDWENFKDYPHFELKEK